MSSFWNAAVNNDNAWEDDFDVSDGEDNNEQQQQEQEESQQQPPPPPGGGVWSGLSRLAHATMEAVAQPDDDDDDDDDDDEMELNHDGGNNEQEQQHQQQPTSFASRLTAIVAPPQPNNNDGWQGDDEDEFIEDDNDGWDDELEGLDSPVAAAPRPTLPVQSHQQQPTVAAVLAAPLLGTTNATAAAIQSDVAVGSGWDEDSNDFLVDSPEKEQEQPSAWDEHDNLGDLDEQEPVLASAPVAAPVMEQNVNSGWDEDDIHIDEDQGGPQEADESHDFEASAYFMVEKEQQQQQDLTAPSQQQPHHEKSSSLEYSGLNQQALASVAWEDSNLEGLDFAETPTKPKPTIGAEQGATTDDASGWDDDESGLEDLDQDEPVATVGTMPTADAGAGPQPVAMETKSEDEEDSKLPAVPEGETEGNRGVVDHVPVNAPSAGAIRDSTAAVASDRTLTELATDEWTDGLGPEDEQDFGPVVDHTPSVTQQPAQSSRSASIVTQALTSDIDVDNQDEETTLQSSTQGSVPSFRVRPVDHVPSGDTPGKSAHHDSTIAIASEPSSTMMGDDEWGEDLEPDEQDYGPVVDHLPMQRLTSPFSRASSLNVQAALLEEIDEEDDDGDEDEKKQSEPIRLNPSSASVADSMAVVAPITEEQDEETTVEMTHGDDDRSETMSQDEAPIPEIVAEEKEAPLVDHVPSRPESGRNDASTLSVVGPSEVSTAGDTNYEEFGPVVDHLPPPRTSVAPSEAVSNMSAVVNVDDLEDDDADDFDDDITEEAGGGRSGIYDNDDAEIMSHDAPAQEVDTAPSEAQVVDHVPVRPESRPRNASLLSIVEPSEMSTVGDATCEAQFGPVVDHLPPPRPSVHPSEAASNMSAVVNVDDLEDDDADDFEDDITEEAGGGRSGIYDTIDGADTMSADDVPVQESDHLVDHVPSRQPSRRNDASTLSVVGPSEVSTTGDTNFEQYGPVVDVVPPPRPSLTPSEAVSNMSAAANVDDLDDETLEATGGGDDDEAGTMTTSATEEQPNEPHLVDHVPPTPATLRKITSESSIAEPQSVVSTRDDEYGPIVDHTPVPPISDAPTTTSLAPLGALSEVDTLKSDGILDDTDSSKEGARVVDKLPPTNSDVSALDSTATARSVSSKDGTLDASDYGPVVSHLPSPHIARPTSRGGSTTGALATRSEVDYGTTDGATAEGWDSDVGSVSVDEEVTEEMKTPETRNKSVTFMPTDRSPPSLHSLTGKSSSGYADETKRFDPLHAESSAGRGVGYQEDTADVSTRPDNSMVKDSENACGSCAGATTLDCPCVQRIMHQIGDDSAAVIRTMSPEGIPVDVDYKKILEDEITKRVLLEKEVEGYKSMVATLKSEASEAALQQAKVQRRDDAEHQEELSKLLVDHKALKAERSRLEEMLQEANEQEEKLLDEVDNTKRDAEEAAKVTAEAHAEEKERVVKEISSLKTVEKELSEQAKAARLDADSERDDNNRKQALLEELQAKLNKHESDQRMWTTTESALRSEIGDLQRLAQESSSASASEATLGEKVGALNIELANKTSEYEALKSKLAEIEDQLQQSEGRNFAMMKESVRLSKKHEADVSKLGDEMKALAKLHDDELSSQNAIQTELERKNTILESEVEKLKSDNLDLVNQSASRNESRAAENKFREKLTFDMKSLEAKVVALEAEKQEYEQSITSKESRIMELESELAAVRSTSRDLATGTSERESETSKKLKEAEKRASEKEAAVLSLELELSEQSQEIQEITEERDGLLALCAELEASAGNQQVSGSQTAEVESSCAADETAKKEVVALQSQLDDMSAERDELLAARSQYESVSQVTKENAQQLTEQLSTLSAEVSQLLEELAVKECEVKSSIAAAAELESQLLETKKLLSEKDAAIAEIRNELGSARSQQVEASSEKEEAVARYQELESRLADGNRKRDEVIGKLEQIERQEAEFSREIDALVSERDAALLERAALEEDNDELLVQLGLAKHELETQEHEMEALQIDLQAKETEVFDNQESLRNAEDSIRYLELEVEKLRESQSNGGYGTQDTDKSEALRRTIEDLTIANEDLKQQLDDLSSVVAFKDEEIQVLLQEKESFSVRLQDSEDVASRSLARDEQSRSIVQELEERCRHLDSCARDQRQELDRLVTTLRESYEDTSARSASEEAPSFQELIAELERAHADRDNALQRKEVALVETRRQMESLRNTASQSDHQVLADMSNQLEELTARLLESEHRANQHVHRVQELEAAHSASQQELQSTKDKLSTTEAALLDMELELDVKQQDDTLKEQYEGQMDELRQALGERDSRLADAESERVELESRLSALESDLDMEREQVSRAREISSHALAENGELQMLKEKIASLKKQLDAKARELGSADDSLHQELESLRGAVATKDNHIASLEEQLQSLSVEISSSKDLLALKEDEVQRVSLELEDARAEQLLTTQRIANQVLNVASTNIDEAESTDNMRSLIISLSKALEMSESQRAQAIESLLKERKSNADSLRRLGESVKRFYSTLSCGSN